MVPNPDPKQHWNNRKNDISLFSATNQERPYEQLLLNCIIVPPETGRYSNEVNLFPLTLLRKPQEEFVKAFAVTISWPFGFSYNCSVNQFGEQGWRSIESTRLSPMWPGFESWRWRHNYVCWVNYWFSPLLREVFLHVLRFSPLLKNQHFQFPIRSGTLQHVSTSS